MSARPKTTRPQVRDYLKIVEWSKEDRCYVGSAPPLVGRCCHADSEADVLKQLAVITEEVLALHMAEGIPLPPPSAGKQYSGKFLLRVRPEVHQALDQRSSQARESLNSYCARLIEEALLQ